MTTKNFNAFSGVNIKGVFNSNPPVFRIYKALLKYKGTVNYCQADGNEVLLYISSDMLHSDRIVLRPKKMGVRVRRHTHNIP